MEEHECTLYKSGVTAELYDKVYEGVRGGRDVEFYVDEAVKSGGPVLELGCGTGRVLLPIARAGIEITGLDFFEPMLSALREKLKREPEEVRRRVELVKADMRRFELGRKFALVIIPFRPFQHIVEVEDQLSCLASIRDHLVEDGRLIFDVFNARLEYISGPPQVEEHENVAWTRLDDGSEFRRTDRQPRRDLANQILHCELIYYRRWPDGREERHVDAFPFRYFFRFEVEHLLARAGFKIEELYCDFDRAAFGEKYPGEMIFVAAPV